MAEYIPFAVVELAVLALALWLVWSKQHQRGREDDMRPGAD